MLDPEFINSQETIDLRHRILRPGQDISICYYTEDNLSSTFHLGIRDDHGRVISNGTFMAQGHLLFSNARHPYRLRGMATDHAYQKQGLGQRILKKALSELQKRNCDLLWFNARTSAEKFYAKLGFISSPEVFEISGAGPHKVMYKWL